MSIIETNQPNFFGANGEVLANGYIYIGEPNKAPQNFPKTVTFTDSAGGQFEAAQPLRTNSQGQISYQGTAIIASVDGDYSMLILDQNQQEVPDGYIPEVEADLSPTISGTTTWANTLDSLKQINVQPGQIVANVGKTSVDDGEGAWWFIVSNTGSGGDDIDLIDMANGAQGKRIQNPAYQVKDLSDVDAPTARTNLDVYSTTEVYTTTEVDNGFQDTDASTIANYSKATAQYVRSDGNIESGAFDLDAALGFNIWESIGPTGSGADNTWAILDNLPTGTKYIEVMMQALVNLAAPGNQVEIDVSFRPSGTAGEIRIQSIQDVGVATTTTQQHSNTYYVKIPLVDNKFDAKQSSTGDTFVSELRLLGFGV